MKRIVKVLLIMQIVLVCMALGLGPAVAASDTEALLTAEASLSSEAAVERTLADMEAMDAAMAPSGYALAVQVPFRSTLGAQYTSLKENIDSNAILRPSAGRENPAGPLAPPVFKGKNIEGVNQTTGGGWRPPDTHGAVGNTHFVEVTNSHVDMYTKGTGARVKSVTLNSFFGYTATALFDPRCIYDRVWDRYIIISDSFVDTGDVQRVFIAISKTANPLGAWWIYAVDIGSNEFFFDYPQLGMDQDAIILTANIFSPSSFLGAETFAVSKAALYNGWGWSVPVYTGLSGTLAPPIVLDSNGKAFMVSAPGGTGITTVYKYTMEKAGRSDVTLSAPAPITVSSYSVPPSAAQPGTASTLDTLDARFVNASTQVGDSLFQVHTVAFGSWPAPHWYEFNTTTNTVSQSSFFYASGTSYDWNASIAANDAKDVYVTWSSTDPASSVNVQVRFSGRKAADPPTIWAGSSLFQSTTFYDPTADQPERWGDYSAVSVDPTNSNFAWIVNEKINSSTVWGTRIGRIGF